MNKREHYPQLDSIRAISFLAIFTCHSLGVHFADNFSGHLLEYAYKDLLMGVDVFFVLSAFLLTWLGIREYEKNKRFSLGNYFKRRALRIWPLYYLILFFAFVILPVIAQKLHIHVTLPPPFSYLLFIVNYADNTAHVYFLGFLWTLSVEEQFYFILGLCLRFLYRYMTYLLLLFLGTGIFCAAYVTLFNIPYNAGNIVFFLVDFAVGGLAALLLHKKGRIARFMSDLTVRGTILFYLYLPFHFTLFYLLSARASPAGFNAVKFADRYLFVTYIALFIMEQLTNKNRTRIFERSKALAFTGRISYGLYVYHGITLTLVTYFYPCGGCLRNFVIVFVMNYIVALLSYYFFELPFLRLKKRA